MTKSTKSLSRSSPAQETPSLWLVHAEDHLTMAIMAIDFAEEFIALYRKMNG